MLEACSCTQRVGHGGISGAEARRKSLGMEKDLSKPATQWGIQRGCLWVL